MNSKLSNRIIFGHSRVKKTFIFSFQIFKTQLFLMSVTSSLFNRYLCFRNKSQCSLDFKCIETDAQNLQLTNVRFLTNSSHFFTNYINIFHKTEVQAVWGAEGIWLLFGSKVITQMKNAKIAKIGKTNTQINFFLQNCKKRKYLLFLS